MKLSALWREVDWDWSYRRRLNDAGRHDVFRSRAHRSTASVA